MFLKKISPAYIMALSASFMMAGYEFIRSSSNALLKDAYGVEFYPFIWGLLPLILPVVLICYGKGLTRLGPRKTLLVTIVISALGVFSSFLLIKLQIRFATALLMIIRESYIILFVEQVWSFINAISSKEKMRYLYGRVLAISAVGAIFGDICVYFLAKRIGAVSLVGSSLVCFIIGFYFAQKAYKRVSVQENKKFDSLSLQRKDPLGLKFFKTHPVLVFMFLIVFASQVYGTIIAINYESVLHRAIPGVDEQTSYAATIFGSLHCGSLLCQLFVIPILLKHVHTFLIHSLIPVIHLFFCFLLIFYPSLETASLSFLFFKLIDYSIFKVAKESLYLPLSLDIKFRSKEVIDVFAYRLAKGLTALSITCLQRLGFVVHSVSGGLLGLFVVCIWLLGTMKVRVRQTAKEGFSDQ